MFKAASIMTRNPLAVGPDVPTYEAMKLLVDNDITGLPVVDDDGGLLGVVSEKDMLYLLNNPSDMGATVSDVMTRDVVTFDESDDLIDVCECLINSNFRRIPVMASGKLVGIISRRDIIEFILKARNRER